MIEVKNLSKRYGKNNAVDDISFSIQEGEILGFLGPNGAGKTTTMNIITGYISGTSGNVLINGHDILNEPFLAKKDIGYLPEQPPLYLDMTVKEYLDFVYDLKRVKLSRKRHIEEVCELVKITHVYKRLIKNLSKGYRQRVGLAQALIGNPKVLILDEPTVGLDPKQIIEIRNVIRSLSSKHTIILSSHILSEVQATCDRIIVIHKGNIIADDTADNLSKSLSNEHYYYIRVEGPEAEIFKNLQSIKDMKEVIPNGEPEKGVFAYRVEAKENTDIRREIFKRFSERKWPILELKSSSLTLEEVFLKLTEGEYSSDKIKKASSKKNKDSMENEKNKNIHIDNKNINEVFDFSEEDFFNDFDVEEEASGGGAGTEKKENGGNK